MAASDQPLRTSGEPAVSSICAVRAGWQDLAPEAHAAAAAYRVIADDVPTALGHCASGRELIDIGFADDVRTAAQLDSGGAVPLLRDGAFIPA